MKEMTMKEYDEEIVNIIYNYCSSKRKRQRVKMRKAIADFNETVKIIPFNKDKEREA